MWGGRWVDREWKRELNMVHGKRKIRGKKAMKGRWGVGGEEEGGVGWEQRLKQQLLQYRRKRVNAVCTWTTRTHTHIHTHTQKGVE